MATATLSGCVCLCTCTNTRANTNTPRVEQDLWDPVPLQFAASGRTVLWKGKEYKQIDYLLQFLYTPVALTPGIRRVDPYPPAISISSLTTLSLSKISHSGLPISFLQRLITLLFYFCICFSLI